MLIFVFCANPLTAGKIKGAKRAGASAAAKAKRASTKAKQASDAATAAKARAASQRTREETRKKKKTGLFAHSVPAFCLRLASAADLASFCQHLARFAEFWRSPGVLRSAAWLAAQRWDCNMELT